MCVLDSADFDFNPQTITFPGDKDILPVLIQLNDDMIVEEKEVFIVALNITGSDKEVVVGKQDTIMVTIEDNDGVYVAMYLCIFVCIYLCLCIMYDIRATCL